MGQNNQEYRLKYWATRSSIRSHRSLICLLHPACFARALRCAHLFAHSLTSLTSSLVGEWKIRWLIFQWFFSVSDHSAQLFFAFFSSFCQGICAKCGNGWVSEKFTHLQIQSASRLLHQVKINWRKKYYLASEVNRNNQSVYPSYIRYLTNRTAVLSVNERFDIQQSTHMRPSGHSFTMRQITKRLIITLLKTMRYLQPLCFFHRPPFSANLRLKCWFVPPFSLASWPWLWRRSCLGTGSTIPGFSPYRLSSSSYVREYNKSIRLFKWLIRCEEIRMKTKKRNKYRGVHKMRLLYRHSLYDWLWNQFMTFNPQKWPYSSFENNTGRTDGRTRPLIEMRSRI